MIKFFSKQIKITVRLILVSVNNEVVEENAVMKVLADGSKLIQNYPHYGQAYENFKKYDICSSSCS